MSNSGTSKTIISMLMIMDDFFAVWVIKLLFNWFVAQWLGLPMLTYPIAFGIGLLLVLFKPTKLQKEVSAKEMAILLISKTVLQLIALIVGFITVWFV